MALTPEQLEAYWQQNPEALQQAVQQNPEAFGLLGDQSSYGQAQQNRINDLLKAYQTNPTVAGKNPSEWDDRQLRLAAASIFNATQQMPSRDQFSQEQLEMMGRAKGDANAFTTHPQAQSVWESSIASGTMPFRNIGYDTGAPDFQNMDRAQLQQMVSGFLNPGSQGDQGSVAPPPSGQGTGGQQPAPVDMWGTTPGANTQAPGIQTPDYGQPTPGAGGNPFPAAPQPMQQSGVGPAAGMDNFNNAAHSTWKSQYQDMMQGLDQNIQNQQNNYPVGPRSTRYGLMDEEQMMGLLN